MSSIVTNPAAIGGFFALFRVAVGNLLICREARPNVEDGAQRAALAILKALHRHIETGEGRQLEAFDPPLLRLRLGDCRFPAQTPRWHELDHTHQRPALRSVRLDLVPARCSHPRFRATRLGP